MKMVDESERIWGNIDNLSKTQGDHCIRITKLEQDHLWKEKNKANKIVYLLAGIVILEFLFLAWDKIW